MKKLLTFVFLALVASLAKAQTVTIPPASSPVVQLSWTIPAANPTTGWGGCTTASPCTFRPFRIAGTCPATIVGSTGWTQLTDTGNNAATATDSTATGQVSYIVETVQVQNGTPYVSAPSNCTTVTVPNVPSPVTNLTAH